MAWIEQAMTNDAIPALHVRSLVYPRSILEGDVRRLLSGASRIWHALGLSRQADGLELIVQGAILTEKRDDGPCVEIMLARDHWAVPDSNRTPIRTARVELGDGRLTGQMRGWWHSARGVTRVGRVLLSGPGMEVIEATARHAPNMDAQKFSRALAALGPDVFHRLMNLRFGFVGVGRLNSTLLARFAASGYLADCVLIDPDAIESHNTGQSLIFDEDSIGLPKVDACENWLALHYPEITVRTSSESITRWPAIDLLKTCDVICCAADHPSARLSAAMVACAYGKVLIDLGTQLPMDSEPGADIRFVGPGRCLICTGSVRGELEAARVLASPQAESDLAANRDWRAERRGSLDTLNDLAATLAKRLVERWVAATLATPAWLQVDEGGATDPIQLRSAGVPPTRSGCLCRLAGAGDAAPPQLHDLIVARFVQLSKF